MIEISGLTKAYGDTTVLDGIDLSVGDGQIAAVVGPRAAPARAPSPAASISWSDRPPERSPSTDRT
jgi:hypothetical protein